MTHYVFIMQDSDLSCSGFTSGKCLLILHGSGFCCR
uniref:Uncharacterized protein n=1 Tax=Anguilla anguilla TaxID=7936 RepID=A0A0E9VS25_ANGAN